MSLFKGDATEEDIAASSASPEGVCHDERATEAFEKAAAGPLAPALCLSRPSERLGDGVLPICVLPHGHDGNHADSRTSWTTTGAPKIADAARVRCPSRLGSVFGKSCAGDAGHVGGHMAEDGAAWADTTDFEKILHVRDRHYASLRAVLDRAYAQAAGGKGRERHASGEPFEEQPIVILGKWMQGSTAFNVGQACKKSLESVRLPQEKAVSELLGAINYLAGAVLILEASGD